MKTDNIKVVIVEDEEESLLLLRNLIQSTSNATVEGSVSDTSEALEVIIRVNPDIVFLDIKMPGRSGFDILDDLRKVRSVNPFIVFTTAYDEYAVRAFEYAAFDYLLKPVEPKRLADTFLRFIDIRKTGGRQQTDLLLSTYRRLQFRSTSGIIFIDHSDIIYIEAEGNYSVFHMCNSKKETVTVLLGKIEEQLPRGTFFRISRSYLVNLDYLKKVNTKHNYCILNKDGQEYRCDISRDKIFELIEIMKNH